jgi:hypothetical protein
LPVCQNRDVLWTELRWYNWTEWLNLVSRLPSSITPFSRTDDCGNFCYDPESMPERVSNFDNMAPSASFSKHPWGTLGVVPGVVGPRPHPVLS